MQNDDLSLSDRELTDVEPQDGSNLIGKYKWLRFRRRASYFSGIFLVLVFIVFIVGLFIRKPVVAVKPGDAIDTASLIQIEGVNIFPNEGEVLLTTAIVQNKPSLWEYYWLKYVESDVSLSSEEEFNPVNISDEEIDELNEQDMINSQDRARVVALGKLGFFPFNVNVYVQDVGIDTAASDIFLPKDIITSFEGTEINSSTNLIEMIQDYSPGDSVEFEIKRFENGLQENKVLSIELGENPEVDGKPLVGIILGDQLTAKSKVELDELGLTIDFLIDDIGGPSAGLALTVEILDVLTEGDLLGGKSVAFTGVINLDESIGRVGGVPQKAVGVKDDGIKHFFVPGDPNGDPDDPENFDYEEIQELKKLVGDDVNIIRVANLDDVLEGIDKIGGDSSPIVEYVSSK